MQRTVSQAMSNSSSVGILNACRLDSSLLICPSPLAICLFLLPSNFNSPFQTFPDEGADVWGEPNTCRATLFKHHINLILA